MLVTERRRHDAIRRNTRELYRLLGVLGDQLFHETLALCDDEREAVAWASAILIQSLEERRLLARIQAAP